MTLNPPGQYADDRNLRTRQRFWQHQHPFFDTVGWVLDLAGLSPGLRVLDAGCGNGAYLRGLRDRQVRAAGCDLSAGMLRAVSHPALLNADVAALPVRDGAVDIVLETPGWQMRPATHAFSAENAPAQLGAAFESVTCVRPAINVPVIIRDATVAADYMASLASHHQDETTRPWDDVVEDVRQHVQAAIDDKGAFTTSGDLAAFICR